MRQMNIYRIMFMVICIPVYAIVGGSNRRGGVQ